MTAWVKSPDAEALAPFWTPEFSPSVGDWLASTVLIYWARLTEAVQGVKAPDAEALAPFWTPEFLLRCSG